MASFQSLYHRGAWRVGGGTAAVAAATSCVSAYMADRAGLEVSRRTVSTVVQTQQQRFQQHYFFKLAQQQQQLRNQSSLQQHFSYNNHHSSTKRFFSSSESSSSTTAASSLNKKAEEAAAKKIDEAAASAKTASTTTRPSFVEWYEGHLENNPLPTKMVTGSILWSLGDAVAQVVPPMAAGSDAPLDYDMARTGRACLFGFAIHAPTSHLHFNFLEYLTNRVGVTGLGIPVFKTIMEQFVYWSWVSNTLYHGFMGLMQGKNLSEVYQRLKDVLWDTQKAQWAFWIPVQLLNFQFIPVRHQLNVVLVTSVVWTALLSAWYPPVDEEEEGTVAKA